MGYGSTNRLPRNNCRGSIAVSTGEERKGGNMTRVQSFVKRWNVAQIRTFIVLFLLIVGVVGFAFPPLAQAAACEALVGQWAWFIGGEVTVNPDGTFTQQSGNAGTWECTDAAQGKFTLRWRDGGFVNSVVLSPDGQGLTSTDQSQWYVTAQRSGPGPKPALVRKENCCQEEFGCETKRIEAEFAQKLAQCHHTDNAGCNAEAVRTKASQLKTANEKLRLCQREAASGILAGTEAGGAPSVSNDEFHSTERTGGSCQPCGFAPDQATGGGGDAFHSDSPGSGQGQPPSPAPGDGPLPWEQPAEAQTPRRVPAGTAQVTLKWDESVKENGQTIRRTGDCSFSIEFYDDGWALAKNFRYHNEDRTQPFPDRIDVAIIHGVEKETRYLGNLKVDPIANNANYNISWTNPTIDATSSKRYEDPVSGNPVAGPETPSTGGYKAYCIGRSGDGSLVTTLRNVALQGNDPPQDTKIAILRDLQKQAPKSAITVKWNVPLPRGSLLNRTRGPQRRQ